MNFMQAHWLRCEPRNVSIRASWALLALVALACCLRPTQVSGATRNGVVHAYMVVDAQTGHVLEAYHSRLHAHPASLTKLMTLYLTFQRLESGKLHLGTRIPVSRHAAAQAPMKLWLRPGSTITVQNAILGITTLSANDAAVVLAEHLGGSESRFVRSMNHEAALLGMSGTRFYNASGLPNSGQWTTARDMAILAVAIIHTFPQYYHFFSVRSFRFRGRAVYGHDHLLDMCEGVDGMKTGYIRTSGYNLVTSAIRQNRRLVGVVFGGATANARDAEMNDLINSGFRLRTAPKVETAQLAAPVPIHRGAAVSKLVRTSADETAAPESRSWGIEVGGILKTQSSVRRVLHAARLTAPSSLRHGHAEVLRLRGSHYRAIISRLHREEAAEACSVLSRKKFTCRLVGHGRSTDQQVASTGKPSAGDND